MGASKSGDFEERVLRRAGFLWMIRASKSGDFEERGESR